ncbi:cyclic nucleotide-binding domain-containing protein [Acidobacteriota bacterium]
MDLTLPLLGLFWGLVSAVSLPLGACIGLWTIPTKKVTSALMAFGGGALLFALTIELFGHAIHVAADHHGKIIRPGIVLTTMAAAVLGGLIFEFLNQLLNNKGAFLRKGSVLKKYLTKQKRTDAKRLLSSLSKVKILQSLPADDIAKLVPHLKKAEFKEGATIFKEGAQGKELYFVDSGKVRISHSEGGKKEQKEIAVLGDTDVFGEMALISNQPRTATATAETQVKAWMLQKSEFEEAIKNSPQLQKTVQKLAEERIQDLSEKTSVTPHEARKWQSEANNQLANLQFVPTDADIAEQVEKHGGKGGAAMAIWLGIALDGIPESLVIGMLVITAAAQNTSMSLAFIAGVFLANLPEAMSSAVTMQKNGMKMRRIMLMWSSLCIMTGVGALIGASIFPPHPDGFMQLFIFGIKGLAAGAMLTMIAETMLPEAFEQGGGTIVGLSTLAGFLAALAVKLIH